jgi:hypothetical protein
MSSLFEGALAIPIFSVATLALLPFAKGAVIGFSWALGVTRNAAGNPKASLASKHSLIAGKTRPEQSKAQDIV